MTTFPRSKIAYRFATTPTAAVVCGACGRWTDVPQDEDTHSGCCGGTWVRRADLHTGEIAAAAAFAIAGGVL
jgi:hypothetical protein